MHYINMAWTYQSSGYIIDSAGNVRTYNLSKTSTQWNFPDSTGYISKLKLDENISRCKLIATKIDNDTLEYYSTKIEQASRGNTSEPSMTMADFGEKMYLAYIYDSQKKRYKAITLKIWGD